MNSRLTKIEELPVAPPVASIRNRRLTTWVIVSPTITLQLTMAINELQKFLSTECSLMQYYLFNVYAFESFKSTKEVLPQKRKFLISCTCVLRDISQIGFRNFLVCLFDRYLVKIKVHENLNNQKYFCSKIVLKFFRKRH